MKDSFDPLEMDIKAYLNEFHIINRIISALSSTTNLHDIYGIILSSLISPKGLNFTRSVLFEYDRHFDAFTGSLVMGPSTRKEATEFNEEMDKEEKALCEILEECSLEDMQSGEDLWASCMMDLRFASLWISSVQKFGEMNPVTESVRHISLSCNSKQEGEDFLHRACDAETPLYIDAENPPWPMPESLRTLMDKRFITIPIRSKNRKLAIVLVDRKFSSEPLSEADVHHLKWFSTQASLAVENAVLYKDLESAYKDLKQMDILKSNFLSTVSHELRTPLTTIHGFVDLLMEGKVGEITEKQKSLLKRASQNSRHLITMVNDILEVAEIQAHGVEDIKIQKVDPLHVMMSAISYVKQRKDKKDVNINPRVRGDIPRILSEEHSLERIYYHILDNAVKFSDNNARITIDFLRKNGELHTVISDEGIGIDEENLQRIFDDFFQVDSKLNRAFEGLGLGLTICRLLLSATGGKILAESTPGKGSTFTVVYPVSE